MEPEVQIAGAFATALIATFALTPVAISLAGRIGYFDQPGTGISYKTHTVPTPYLGGLAVIAGFLLSGTFVTDLRRLWPLFAVAVALLALGTLDDRVNVSWRLRLIGEFALASALWALGLGWEVFDSAALDLIATNLWLVGVANAFNLIDNMDGVATTVAGVTCLVAGVLAAVGGDFGLAALSAGLAGACAGFLPWNARPARIFLGDGGSLPVGFLIAATIMLLPNYAGQDWAHLLLAPVLAGLPLIDTILRMTWRRRAGVPLLQGGKDSITHILQRRLGSADNVAWVAGGIQAVLGVIAVGVTESGRGWIVLTCSLWLVTTAACVVLLERLAWEEEPVVELSSARGHGSGGAGLHGFGGRMLPLEAAAILFIAVSCALSPVIYGFDEVDVWGPIAFFVVAILVTLVLARPDATARRVVLAVAGLATLLVWSLQSPWV